MYESCSHYRPICILKTYLSHVRFYLLKVHRKFQCDLSTRHRRSLATGIKVLLFPRSIINYRLYSVLKLSRGRRGGEIYSCPPLDPPLYWYVPHEGTSASRFFFWNRTVRKLHRIFSSGRDALPRPLAFVPTPVDRLKIRKLPVLNKDEVAGNFNERRM